MRGYEALLDFLRKEEIPFDETTHFIKFEYSNLLFAVQKPAISSKLRISTGIKVQPNKELFEQINALNMNQGIVKFHILNGGLLLCSAEFSPNTSTKVNEYFDVFATLKKCAAYISK